MIKKISTVLFCALTAIFVIGCASTPDYTALELMKKEDYEGAKDKFKPKEDINAQDAEGNTVLHLAAKIDRDDLCTYFINKEANTHIKNDESETPLITSIHEDGAEAAKTIVDLDPVTLFDIDNHGKAAVDIGLERDPVYYDYFITPKTGLVTDKNGNTIVHHFVETQNLTAVKVCMNKKLPLSQKNNDELTPLEIAFGLFEDEEKADTSVEIAATLIEGGADEVETVYSYFQDAVASRNLSLRFEDGQTPLHFAAMHGHTAVAKFLLEGDANTSAQDSAGATPLHEAIRYGNLEVARLLLAGGANVNATDNLGKTPIMIIPPKDKITQSYELLITYGADLNQKDMFGDTVIHNATMMSVDTKTMAMLVGHGADINARNKEGVTPLEIAVQKQNLSVVKLLTSYGANIHTKDKDGHSPLSLSMGGSMELFEAVLNENNATSQDSEGNTPLHTALLVNASTDKIQYILANTTDVNIRNREGNTALYLATIANNKMVGEWLLGKDADIFSANEKNDSPLRIALRRGGSIMDWLITSKTIRATDGSGNTALHYAAEWKYGSAINALLVRGADISARNANGETPLFNAAKSNSPEIIQIIVDGGADIQARDNLGSTAIHIAVRWDAFDAIDKLMSLGINVDAQNTAGKSPLAEAVAGNRVKMAKKLISVGADTNSCDTDGVTVLVDAIKTCSKEMVTLLLDNGANPQIQDINGRNAYHEAAYMGDKDIIILIRNQGGNPLARDKQGDTPFSLVLGKDLAVIKEVLGTSKNITDSDGNSPIHIVVKAKASSVLLKYLIKARYPIDTRNSDGYTALNYAIEVNDLDNAKILLESGANPFQMIDKKGRNGVTIALENNNMNMISNIVRYAGTRTDVQGNTILHYAAKLSDVSTVKSLLDSGLNKNVKNVSGDTPYTIATRWKKSDVAALLK